MLTLTSPFETRLHRLPAGLKLGLLAVFTLSIMWIRSPLVMALAFGGVIVVHLLAGPALLPHAARMIRPLAPFVVLIMVWHAIASHWHPAALHEGILISLRMLTAVAAANLVTMTTPLAAMLEVIERLCRPLAPVLPPRRLALAFAMVLRFIPALGLRMGQLRMAWRARSHRAPGWRIIVPAVLAAMDDADHAAEALRARGGVD